MIDESIETLKNYCEIFRYTQKSMDKSLREICGDTVGVEEVSAIETLLTAYEKEKEKNKELQDRVDYLAKISGLLSIDTIINEEE